jgi:hypothetical protein
MTIFSEALFPFVSSDLVSFSFLSARHSFTFFKLIIMLSRFLTAFHSIITPRITVSFQVFFQFSNRCLNGGIFFLPFHYRQLFQCFFVFARLRQ